MRSTTILLFAFAAFLFSCQRAVEPVATNSQGGSGQAAPSTPPVASETAVAPATAVAASTSTGALASSDAESGSGRVEIQELKRSTGDTVTLKFRIVNSGSDTFQVASMNGRQGEYNTVGGVTLIDAAGKKKYFVVRDTEELCICSRGIKTSIPAGEVMNLWAKFPAPPPDVEKVSVDIPHFIPMDDVPIGR